MEQLPGNELFRFGRPHGTRLIVEADESATTTKSGLIIPEGTRERPLFGTVLAIGKGITEAIEAGDRVMYGKNAGVLFIIQDKTYYMMQEREIFMTLNEDEIEKVQELLAE